MAGPGKDRVRHSRMPYQIGPFKVYNLFTKKTSENPLDGIKGKGNRKGAVQ